MVDEQGLGEILFLTIQAPGRSSILITNMYDALPGATNPGAGVNSLLSITNFQPPKNWILAGNLNLDYKDW